MVAVLSDDPVVQQKSTTVNIGHTTTESQFEQNTNIVTAKSKKEKAKPKTEPIKLKIKTNTRLRNNTELVEQTEEPEIYRGRSTRRKTPQQTATTIGNSVEENVLVPGTANYELYRTLTESPPNQPLDPSQSLQLATTSDSSHISPEYQHFATTQLNQANLHVHQSTEIDAQNCNTNSSDTERGILPKKRRGKNKTKFEANIKTVPEEPVQKKQRNRRKHDDQLPELTTEIVSRNEFANNQTEIPTVEEIAKNYPKKRITAAAKKQYKDENVSVAKSPNLLPSQIEDIRQSEETYSEPTINRRGRKAKEKQSQSTAKTDQMPQSEVSHRPIRTTRHTANGNMTRVRFY